MCTLAIFLSGLLSSAKMNKCCMSSVMLQMQLQCWFILHLERMFLYLQLVHVILIENQLLFSSSATAISSPNFLYVQLQICKTLKCHCVGCFITNEFTNCNESVQIEIKDQQTWIQDFFVFILEYPQKTLASKARK